MTAPYTRDVSSSLDGYGSHNGGLGGYWGKQGPELLEHRFALSAAHRMVFGANAYRQFVEILGSSTEGSEVRRRSHGSLALNHALMAAGLVDCLEVTMFPVITGRTGLEPSVSRPRTCLTRRASTSRHLKRSSSTAQTGFQ